MREIPTVAWVILIILAVTILVMNIGLIASFWKKNTTRPTDNLRDIGKVLRNPWYKEDEQLEKLAQKAKEIRENQPPEPGEKK